jgi:hypothetical protein
VEPAPASAAGVAAEVALASQPEVEAPVVAVPEVEPFWRNPRQPRPSAARRWRA